MGYKRRTKMEEVNHSLPSVPRRRSHTLPALFNCFRNPPVSFLFKEEIISIYLLLSISCCLIMSKTTIKRSKVEEIDTLLATYEYGDALQALEEHLQTDNLYASSTALHIHLCRGDLSKIGDIQTELVQNARKMIKDEKSRQFLDCNSFFWIMNQFSGEECKIFAEMFMQYARRPARGQIEKKRYPKDQYRIAYLSSEWRTHPLGIICHDVIANHNPGEFTVSMFNTSDEPLDEIGDALTKQFVALARPDSIKNGNLSPKKLALEVLTGNYNFCIELNGLMSGNQVQALCNTSAPITLTIFGFPGTTGSQNLDYFVADKHTVPLDKANGWFTEKVAYMEDSCYTASHFNYYSQHRFHERVFTEQNEFMVLNWHMEIPKSILTKANIKDIWEMIENGETHTFASGHKILNGNLLIKDETEITVSSRKGFGFPDHKFIYGFTNQSLKLEPKIFNVMMNILTATEDTALVILTSHDDMAVNLKAFAPKELRERIFFFPVATKSTYMRMLSSIDVFLDPEICNGHTSSLDCIWSGGPIVTIEGDNFHSRVGKSLMECMRIPGLVTTSHHDYIKLAVLLKNYPKFTKFLREEIECRKLDGPLFDTSFFTFNFENLLKKMWRIFMDGQPPQQIDPNPTPPEWHMLFETLDDIQFEHRASESILDKNVPMEIDQPVGDSSVPTVKGTQPSTSIIATENLINQDVRMEVDQPVEDSHASAVEEPQPSTSRIMQPPVVPAQIPRAAGQRDQITPINSKIPQLIIERIVVPAQQIQQYLAEIRINFRKPSRLLVRAGDRDMIPRGQGAIAMVAIETCLYSVLQSFLTQTNIEDIFAGPLMANQFMARVEEYWNGSLIPVFPINLDDKPNFYKSELGLKFSDKSQLGWLLQFFDAANGQNHFPTVETVNIFDMHHSTVRRTTRKKCAACPNYLTEAPMSANTIVSTHGQNHHLTSPNEAKCIKCHRVLATMNDSLTRTTHIAQHVNRPDNAVGAEVIYGRNEASSPNPSTRFKVNLFESFEAAIARFRSEGVNEAHHYHQLQFFVTFSIWLSPAVNRVVKHLLNNPTMISETGNIGYQIKAMLQFHLRTWDCPVVENIFAMQPEERQLYAKRHLKFMDYEHTILMLRGFDTYDSVTRTGYAKRTQNSGANTDFPCKMCKIKQSTSQHKIAGLIKDDHLLSKDNPRCKKCGFEFTELVIRDFGNLENAKKYHKEVHEGSEIENWNEFMITQPSRETMTHVINLRNVN